MSQPAPTLASSNLPRLITSAGDRAGIRFMEFFGANIRNPHTRRAYNRAVADFLACATMSACNQLHKYSRFTLRDGLSCSRAITPPLPRNYAWRPSGTYSTG